MGNNKKCWAVGSNHDGEDVTNFFLKNNVWYDGYAEHGDFKYVNTLKEINVGDILVMKSSATKVEKTVKLTT